MKYSREHIQKVVQNKEYKWFNDDSNKGFDVNIVGIRNAASKKVTNIFDDLLTISYKDNGVWQYKEYAATTDPGKKAMVEFQNKKGVARLVSGQYRGMHSLGFHQGKYEALCQRKECTVYRDWNKDQVYDEIKTDTGIFGINIHHAGTSSTFVENWSEGCQVFKKIVDFSEFREICKKASLVHGNSFTYTLIETKDL